MNAEPLARPELIGNFGMVSSTHWLASQCGMSVLERGGNAFDAATAAAFVLQVVEPHLNGIGGDVPIMGWDSTTQSSFVLCGQGPAPRAATIDAFADLGLDAIPGSGLLAACVPGAFGAWIQLARDRGTFTLRDLLEYAIHYARTGFVCLPKIASTIDSVRPLFEQHWGTSQDLWLTDNRTPQPGSKMRNPLLAETLERIVIEAESRSSTREGQLDGALDVFYRGFVAEAITSYISTSPAMDSSGRAHTGLLSGDDLANWSPTYENPVSIDYLGHTVLKVGAWSQGPVFLQQLALLKGWDLSDYDPQSAEFVHLVTECAKLAFADREAHYGDPDFTGIDVNDFLTESYNAERRKLVTASADTGPLRPGSPNGMPIASSPVIAAANPSGAGLGEPTFGTVDEGRGDTCHVDVMDRWGNVVAATPSGGWLQSSPAVPGLGFALGTRAQMFWLSTDHPNGLLPGKRPRTTLSPSMTLLGDMPYLAFGTPGGDTQDQSSLAFLLRHLHHDMNLQEAIEAPAFFTDHFPSSFYPRESNPGGLTLESRFSKETVSDLGGRGHRVQIDGPWSIGRLSAVSRTADGTLRAAANPRGAQGYAVGR